MEEVQALEKWHKPAVLRVAVLGLATPMTTTFSIQEGVENCDPGDRLLEIRAREKKTALD